jgi:hypothetical protein
MPPRERKPTDSFTFKEKGGTNPTPPPVDPTTKKKPKYTLEPINEDGSSRSYVRGGFLPVLRPTSQVAAGGSAVAPPTGGTSPVVITDDDWEPTSPTGTSPVGAGGSAVAAGGSAGGWGGLKSERKRVCIVIPYGVVGCSFFPFLYIYIYIIYIY